MAQYLLQFSYTGESLAKQIKNPVDRIDVVGKQLAASSAVRIVGGGYTFGEYDMAIIVDAPDDTTMAALALALSAGGACKTIRTTPLLTGAEWIDALKKAPSLGYTPAP